MKKQVRYYARKPWSEDARKLAKADTQAGAIYRAVSNGPKTFAEILVVLGEFTSSKRPETIVRWYIADLHRRGLLSSRRRVREENPKVRARKSRVRRARRNRASLECYYAKKLGLPLNSYRRTLDWRKRFGN
jgi:hypothetical protein